MLDPDLPTILTMIYVVNAVMFVAVVFLGAAAYLHRDRRRSSRPSIGRIVETKETYRAVR